jgi:hypothetical protein
MPGTGVIHALDQLFDRVVYLENGSGGNQIKKFFAFGLEGMELTETVGLLDDCCH